MRKVAATVFVPFKITRETKFGLLIDIQKKIQEGKGEAYEKLGTHIISSKPHAL